LTTAAPSPGSVAGMLSFDTWANQPGGTLSFTSAPFTDGATLAGAMAATIYASTSGTNLQLMATMYSVAPDGTQTFLQDGVLVGSQREVDEAKSWRDPNGLMYRPLHTHTRDEVLTPNVPYRFDIFIEPRLWPLPPGHALRLALSSRPAQANCPPGPALSGSPCYNTDPQEASLAGTTYASLADPTHPSSVNLPLLPYLHFPTATTATLPIDWGPEYQMGCIDLKDATLVMGSRITEARFLPRVDMDKNGIIDGRDVAAIARQARGCSSKQ
jgi:predicted acyl esterase